MRLQNVILWILRVDTDHDDYDDDFCKDCDDFDDVGNDYAGDNDDD